MGTKTLLQVQGGTGAQKQRWRSSIPTYLSEPEDVCLFSPPAALLRDSLRPRVSTGSKTETVTAIHPQPSCRMSKHSTFQSFSLSAAVEQCKVRQLLDWDGQDLPSSQGSAGQFSQGYVRSYLPGLERQHAVSHSNLSSDRNC